MRSAVAPTEEDFAREQRENIGRRIVQARSELGIRQWDFAAALAVNQPRLSEWERGIHAPTPASLRRISYLTGKPYAWFFEEDGE